MVASLFEDSTLSPCSSALVVPFSFNILRKKREFIWHNVREGNAKMDTYWDAPHLRKLLLRGAMDNCPSTFR